MNSWCFSYIVGRMVALVALPLLVVGAGVPLGGFSLGSRCPARIDAAPVLVKATGIEGASRWALILYQNEEILVDEGGSIGGCFALKRVKNNSVVLKLIDGGEEREFFFAGFSHLSPPQARLATTPGDGLMRAVAHHRVVPVSEHVTKVHYPAYSNSNTLPQAVYRNVLGGALYESYSQLGLGEDSAPADEGVRVGRNSSDSVFGSVGIDKGDRIVAINGTFVTTPDEVGRLLKESSKAPIQIAYARGDDPAIYSTAVIIQTK